MENCSKQFLSGSEEADVDAAEEELEKVDIQDEVTDVICDNCGTKHGDQIWSSRTDFWHARDSRNAEIPSHIWRRSVCLVRNAARNVVLKKTKKGQ